MKYHILPGNTGDKFDKSDGDFSIIHCPTCGLYGEYPYESFSVQVSFKSENQFPIHSGFTYIISINSKCWNRYLSTFQVHVSNIF